jgi:hypothetical protein
MEIEDYEFTKSHTQVAKGVAIILMMLHHLFRFPDRIEGVSYVSVLPFFQPTVEYLLGDFGKICVAMYLFLSGYGLYAASSKKGKFTFRDSVQRVVKFLINYWVVFLLFIPIGLIWFSSNPRYHWNVTELIKNFFTLSGSYNGEWWFIRLYIELVLLLPLIKRMLKRGIIFSFAVSLVFYSMYFRIGVVFKIMSILPIKQSSLLYQDLPNLLFWQMSFCTGYIFAKFNLFRRMTRGIKSRGMDKKAFYVAMLSAIIIIRIAMTYILGEWEAPNYDYILAPLFILFCTNFIYPSRSNKVFLALGKHSTNIWLTHSFFCYYYFQKLVFLPKLSVLILIWLTVLCIASSMLINCVTNKFKLSFRNEYL